MQRASRVSVICCGKTPTVTFEIFAAQRLHAKFRFEHSGDLLGLRTLAITHPAFENTRDFVPSDRPPPPRQKSFFVSARRRGRPCSDLSRALRAVHGAQSAKIP